MGDSNQCSTPVIRKQCSRLPGTDEKIESLRTILDCLGSDPSGPIYRGTHKQLAELISINNENEAAFHLCESHGTTLRNEAIYMLSYNIRKGNGDAGVLSNMRERLQFESEWQDGWIGLQKRLSELPSGWTAVQLTLEYDPLSRFPPRNKNINRGLGLYITRFKLGEQSNKLSNKQGGEPFTTFIPALDENEDQLSLMAAMRNSLALMDKSSKESRSKAHEKCDRAITATIQDLQTWIGGWHFLFRGQFINDAINQTIKSSIDSHIASYHASSNQGNSDREVDGGAKQLLSKKELNLIYLMSSCPSMSLTQIISTISSILKNKDFALYMSKKVHSVIQSNLHALHAYKRHPVILIVDEDLDILPFEAMTPLQMQPFTRCPSIHFLHAMYIRHKNVVMRNGVNTGSGFYIINPTKDVPQLDKLYESLSSNPIAQKWKGVFKTCPSQEEFLNGLQENDLFLYCGHGGGNQFLPKDSIERAAVKAVVLLFGCSSSSLCEIGGRVEMSSLAYSYLIAGSPCVVGMLWPVLDKDMNAVTEELIRVLCDKKLYEEEMVNEDIDSLDEKFQSMDINLKERPMVELSKAVCLAKKEAVRMMNRAAIVIRGLPTQATYI